MARTPKRYSSAPPEAASPASPRVTPWAGRTRRGRLGAELTPVLTRGPLALGLRADVWRAPDLALGPNDPNTFSMDWGGALSARADVDLWRGRGGLRAEIGAKTEGLVRGEEIGAGPIVRLGVFLRE